MDKNIAYHCLPAHIRLSTSGTHLYSRGLSLYQFSDEKRSPFYNPYLILAVLTLNCLRCFGGLLIPRVDKQYAIYLADFSTFLNVKIQLNSGLLSYYLLGVIT